MDLWYNSKEAYFLRKIEIVIRVQMTEIVLQFLLGCIKQKSERALPAFNGALRGVASKI